MSIHSIPDVPGVDIDQFLVEWAVSRSIRAEMSADDCELSAETAYWDLVREQEAMRVAA